MLLGIVAASLGCSDLASTSLSGGAPGRGRRDDRPVNRAAAFDRRATALRIIDWLVGRHHQSLGLWPWTWTGPEGEPYATLYAACAALPFGGDFGALANWVEANRWPPVDGRPHPTTLRRDRLTPAGMGAAAADGRAIAGIAARGMALDVEQLAHGGAQIETLAQLLEAASTLDQVPGDARRRNGMAVIPTARRPGARLS